MELPVVEDGPPHAALLRVAALEDPVLHEAVPAARFHGRALRELLRLALLRVPAQDQPAARGGGTAASLLVLDLLRDRGAVGEGGLAPVALAQVALGPLGGAEICGVDK